MTLDHEPKVFLSQYQEVLSKATKNIIPVHATFELTYRCNLRCIHCYLQCEHPRKSNELTTSEYKAFLDSLVDMQTIFLSLTGGEILVREDFFQIAEHARKRHFALRLFTNGTLIDSNAAKRIADLRPVMVEISCYGADEQTYEDVTKVKGSWKKLMTAIEALQREEVPFLLKSVVIKQNVHRLEELVSFFLSHEVPFRIDPMITPLNDGNMEALKDCYLDDDEIFEAMYFLHSRVAEFKNPEEEREVKLRLAHKTTPCGAGNFTFRLNPEGFVSPCLQIPYYAGNIREEKFSKMWKEAEVFKEFRRIRIADFDECMKCKDLAFCRRCIGINKIVSGDYFTIFREFCRFADIKGKAVAKINELSSFKSVFKEYADKKSKQDDKEQLL